MAPITPAIIREPIDPATGTNYNVTYYRGHTFTDHSNFQVLPLELKEMIVQRMCEKPGGLAALITLGQTSKYFHAFIVSLLERCNAPALNLAVKATLMNLTFTQLTDPAAIKAELYALYILLRRGADLGYDDIPAAFLAVDHGHLPLVQEIIRTSRNPLIRVGSVARAALSGQLDILRPLLQLGAISERNRSDSIMNAAKNGHILAVRELLIGSTKPEEDRGIALRFGAEHGHAALVCDVLRAGAINTYDRQSALLNAQRNNHSDVAYVLLQETSYLDTAVYYFGDFMQGLVKLDVARIIMSPIAQIAALAIAYDQYKPNAG